MLQRLTWGYSLVRVQREALLQQVDEVVEMPGFGIVHPCRCSVEPGSQVSRWLHYGQCSYRRLQSAHVSVPVINM